MNVQFVESSSSFCLQPEKNVDYYSTIVKYSGTIKITALMRNYKNCFSALFMALKQIMYT